MPESVINFKPMDWDLLIRQAKAANLLAHLDAMLKDTGNAQLIPEGAAMHLNSASMIARRSVMAVRWELSQLEEALHSLAIPFVVLKGAAYVMADLPISRGRLFHDIDILVPRSALEDVEKRLTEWGWRTTHSSAYDQRYYRTWMHEIPPMKQIKRQTVLDIHHSILPLTARLKPDPGKLFAQAVNDTGEGDLYWLCDVDMILHSATHLFHDGELEHGLRDLVDIAELLKQFSLHKGFWTALCERAEEMDLVRPLLYGLRYVEILLGVDIPAAVKVWTRERESSGLSLMLMDQLFMRALRPDHATCDQWGSSLARWMLYVRSHYLRMPMRLLIPHLIRKAITGDEEGALPREVQRFIANNPRH
ncbi:nucleotidyltransferase domain-containing protein [Sedimenticola sp.]|uniref:nucleotidyltransferase domain-containing protein n=1 Tax=Sedimenticola sp. TaxID=1940285 RepID=UPI003D0CAFD0